MKQDSVKSARAFARDYVAPNSAFWEEAGQPSREAFTQAADAGLTGVIVPQNKGGLGLSLRDASTVLEELAGVNAAFAFALWVHNNVANGIARYGSDRLVNELLPDLIAGRRIGAFCLSEPEKGSDAANISTLGQHSSEGWNLTGRKAWVTNGCVADILLTYAQTEPGSGSAGIAAFLVDGDSTGIERSAPYGLSNAGAFGLADITFQDCAVPEDRMFLPPGEGLRVAMRGINQARAYVGSICNGMLAASLATALTYAAGREVFGKTVLEFQGIQWSLADVATDLEASKLLTRTALDAMDNGEAAVLEAAHAKKFATRTASRGIPACIQAMGAAGLLPRYPLASHLSVAQTMHILDGTTEIQNVVIARMLLDRYGAWPE